MRGRFLSCGESVMRVASRVSGAMYPPPSAAALGWASDEARTARTSQRMAGRPGEERTIRCVWVVCSIRGARPVLARHPTGAARNGSGGDSAQGRWRLTDTGVEEGDAGERHQESRARARDLMKRGGEVCGC